MPTPLFPEEGLHINIKQGRTGDCYLLATLDCLLNGLPENRQHLKSLFQQNEDGSVEIKLQHSELTQYLKTEAFAAKGYGYRKEGKHDVFTITPGAIERIDNDRSGVDSNCLAIKLLEHILPYYYANQVLANQALNSVFAHNQPGRHDAGTSSTQFMGQLLGFNITDKPQTDVDEIIHQKQTHPEKPIYISMSYGQTDLYGAYHGRHALRIKEIVPHASIEGEYRFILSNPHNNEMNEEYLLSDIRKRSPRFSLMDLQPSPSPFAKLMYYPPKAQLVQKQVQIMPPIAEELNLAKEGEKLTDQQIQTMIQSAIDEKKTHGMPLAQARTYVAMSLFRYHLHDDLNRITSAGGLRKHFKDSPEQDSLKFLKQIDLSEENINQQVVGEIIGEYAMEKRLTKPEAQEALLTMLAKYEGLKDINSITRTANLRQLILEGVLSVKTLLKAFPKAEKDQLPGKKAAAIIKDNNPFEPVVADNLLVLFKEQLHSMDQHLLLCASTDFNHRAKEHKWLKQLANAHTFDEIKEKVELAKSDLASGPTYIGLDDILNAVNSSNTIGKTLSEMRITQPKEPSYECFAEAINKIANRKILDVFLDMDTTIKEGWYLTALLQATNYDQIKALTQLAKTELKLEFVHYKVGELIEKISQSEHVDELLSNLNDSARPRF